MVVSRFTLILFLLNRSGDMNIGILTDSTCDLNSELLAKYNIDTIPLNINFAGDIYRDGIDIGTREFYEKMLKTEEIPGTSQPSVGLFMEKYKDMADKYDAILSLHISGKLSGTVKSARLASTQLDDIEIELFDTKSTTLGLGFMVILAAKLVNKGYQIDEIISILEKARENTYIYFSVNDLKYLQKGGRIGKAQAFLGSVLNFNPLLQLLGVRGEVEPYKKIRGNKKTREAMLTLCENIIEKERNFWIGILKGKIDSRVEKFTNHLQKNLEQYEDGKIIQKQGFISPVLASHTGPYVYGFVIVKGDFLDNAI